MIRGRSSNSGHNELPLYELTLLKSNLPNLGASIGLPYLPSLPQQEQNLLWKFATWWRRSFQNAMGKQMHKRKPREAELSMLIPSLKVSSKRSHSFSPWGEARIITLGGNPVGTHELKSGNYGQGPKMSSHSHTNCHPIWKLVRQNLWLVERMKVIC